MALQTVDASHLHPNGIPLKKNEALDQLKRMSLLIVERLLKEGTVRIGDFDLADLKTRLSRVRWKTMNDCDFCTNRAQTISERYRFLNHRLSANYKFEEVFWTAFYDASEPYVILTLHEALGAAGFPDRSYELSLALRYLLGVEKRQRENLLQDPWIRGLFSSPFSGGPRQMTGGFTVVGGERPIVAEGGFTIVGGGDEFELEIKLALLKAFLKKNVDTHFVHHFLKLQTNPLDYDLEDRKIALSSRFDLQPDRPQLDWKNLNLTLFLPSLEWGLEKAGADLKEEPVPLMNQQEILAESVKIVEHLIPLAKERPLFAHRRCGNLRLLLAKPAGDPAGIPEAIAALLGEFEKKCASLKKDGDR